MVCVSTDQTDCQHPQQKTCFIKCACDVPKKKTTNMHTKTERRKNTSLLLVFFNFRWAVHHPCSGALRHTCFSVSHNKTSKACSGALRHTCFLVSHEKPSKAPSLSGGGFCYTHPKICLALMRHAFRSGADSLFGFSAFKRSWLLARNALALALALCEHNSTTHNRGRPMGGQARPHQLQCPQSSIAAGSAL